MSGEVELTYAELDARTDRLAGALLDSGLGHGDRIAVLARTRPEYAELYVAAGKLGATIVGLNIRATRDELRHCIRITAPRLLVTATEFADAISEVPTPAETWWLPNTPCDPNSDWERRLVAITREVPKPDHDPQDIHCILFTSGTTGLPKGVMISERASVIRAFRCADWFGLSPDDGMVGWIPMFHTGGDECVKAVFASGGTFAALDRADPVTLYAAIERYQLTWTAMLPGVLTDFLQHPQRSEYDLRSLRFAFGYANMMPRIVEEFTAAFGAVFWDCFGQTETSFVLACDPVFPGQAPTLKKRPTPMIDVRIVDERLRERPVGVPGECVVRGPSVMSGYLGASDATAEVFSGGWLHTGDVLVRNSDGTLTYLDRLKYMIKTGGENVYPAEVEQVLVAHTAVREASAVGIPDGRWGEKIIAAVILNSGTTCTADELIDWCRGRLAGFKIPRTIHFIEDADVPRSGTGKIQRDQLARRLTGCEFCS